MWTPLATLIATKGYYTIACRNLIFTTNNKILFSVRSSTVKILRVLLELQIMLRDEHFLANHGGFESKGEHLQLPYNVRESSCQTSRKTYGWEDTARDCQLQGIRTISPNRTKGTWLVDHRHRLLLNVTGVYPIPGSKLALKTTQLDNIYLCEIVYY